MATDDRMSKNDKREQAREAARLIRDQQNAKNARNKKIFKALAIVVPIVMIAVIVLAIVFNTKTEKNSTEVIKPANSTELGFVVGPDMKVLGEVPTTPVADAETPPAHVVLYQDYMCPACNSFETSFAPEIEQILQEGVGVIEYRTVTFLDHLSSGTNYSSRSANVAYCVANTYPDKFFDFNALLYANQPAELSAGISNKDLIALADSLGATGLESCVTDGTYRGWAAEKNDAGLEVIKGTPTIIINGEEWDKQGSLYEAVVKAGAAPAITASTAPTATTVPTVTESATP